MLHPEWGPRGEPSTFLEKIKALAGILDILVLFVAIMVALFSGKITATEAAAGGCFIALVLCGARGKLSFAKFKGAMHHTLRISCTVFMIVAGATIFGRFMAISRLPYECATWIGSLSLPGRVILLIMLGIYAAGGCLMDALAFLLISLPIFYPLG
ncbi:MAG: TRAP transporter large permease subunit, partial [Bacillota bacterium]